MARIPVFSNAADVPDKQRAAADQVMAVFGRIRGPFSVLLHSPDLAERLLPMVPFTREHTIVEGPLRSLAILAFVREREGPYVWAAQVDAARRNGLREAAIDLLRAKGDPADLPPEERDIVTYIRQLARTNRVEPAAFDARGDHRMAMAAAVAGAACPASGRMTTVDGWESVATSYPGFADDLDRLARPSAGGGGR